MTLRIPPPPHKRNAESVTEPGNPCVRAAKGMEAILTVFASSAEAG